MKKYNHYNYINHINQWDKKIVLKLNKRDNKSIKIFLKFISFFGRETVWIFLIFLFLFIWYDPILLSYIGTTFINGIWLNVLIKNIINRERPYEALKNLTILEPKPTSRSFPSWHTYNGTAQAIILGYMLISPLFLTIFLIFAIIIGFSRIYLGMHYPSDVIFGFILGIIGALLTIFLFGPLILSFLKYIEQLSLFDIQYRTLNPMLGNAWYLIICFIIFGLILLSATYKYIKKNKENKPD
ncbi:MAG: phosphatase PAP2 family protein [Promethearchaeota archaeon]